jgi:hypothetical protein
MTHLAEAAIRHGRLLRSVANDMVLADLPMIFRSGGGNRVY